MFNIPRPWLTRFWSFDVALVVGVVILSIFGASTRAFEPTPIEQHEPLKAGEHPRLIFRDSDAPARWKETAQQSEFGQRVLERLDQTVRLMDKAPAVGRSAEVVREAGYRAAGHAARFAMHGDGAAAKEAAKIVRSEVIGYPLRGQLDTRDRIAQLAGAAFAYDLAYDGWSQATREEVRRFLHEESDALLEKVGGIDARRYEDELWILAVTGVGLADLATLGDDEGSDGQIAKRLDATERAVLAYLDQAISPDGFGAMGESIRLSAMASGILPYTHALRHVRGRDLSDHPAVRHALKPMIYFAVPGAGMPILGPRTVQVDRTGIFAQAGRFLPDAQKPAAKWLLFQLGGEQYAGVVRPHHALFMLDSGLIGIDPAPPGDAWPRTIQAAEANLALIRSDFSDSGDRLLVVQDGVPRLLGLGARWLSLPGPHAHIWSDSPGAGEIDNRFLYLARPTRHTRIYHQSAEYRLQDFTTADNGESGSMRFTFSGELRRTREQYETEQRVDGEKVKTTHEVAPGGKFGGERLTGVDFTGRAGTEAIVVFDDRFHEGPDAMREWVMHLGRRFEMEGNTFTFTAGDVRLRGTVILPESATVTGTANAPTANFIHLPTDADRVQVIITLHREGDGPKIKAGPGGLDDGVQVGDTTIRRVDDAIVFE